MSNLFLPVRIRSFTYTNFLASISFFHYPPAHSRRSPFGKLYHIFRSFVNLFFAKNRLGCSPYRVILLSTPPFVPILARKFPPAFVRSRSFVRGHSPAFVRSRSFAFVHSPAFARILPRSFSRVHSPAGWSTKNPPPFRGAGEERRGAGRFTLSPDCPASPPPRKEALPRAKPEPIRRNSCQTFQTPGT